VYTCRIVDSLQECCHCNDMSVVIASIDLVNDLLNSLELLVSSDVPLFEVDPSLTDPATGPAELGTRQQFCCIFVLIFHSRACTSLACYMLLIKLSFCRCFYLPVWASVLWHCWLGDRKDIRPVKKTNPDPSVRWPFKRREGESISCILGLKFCRKLLRVWFFIQDYVNCLQMIEN